MRKKRKPKINLIPLERYYYNILNSKDSKNT